jgi:hypothetical protein
MDGVRRAAARAAAHIVGCGTSLSGAAAGRRRSFLLSDPRPCPRTRFCTHFTPASRFVTTVHSRLLAPDDVCSLSPQEHGLAPWPVEAGPEFVHGRESTFVKFAESQLGVRFGEKEWPDWWYFGRQVSRDYAANH